MKRIIPILLLSVFIVGCAAPAQTQLPIVTVTSTRTSTPTLTPTATETPTPTKDPNAPPEYSRFENAVYYLDTQTENGNTLTYMWNLERNVYERLYFAAPVWDKEKVSNDVGAQDMFQLTVLIDKNIEGEAQLPTPIHHENVDPPNSRNFANFFRDVLLSKMADAGIVPNRNSIDLGPIRDGSHAFHFDFVNADGPQSWGIWEGTTITVHIRGDYDQLKAEMDTNGFSETKSIPRYGPTNKYMVKVSSENGNLIVEIAPSLRPATSWTQDQLMEMFMFGPAAVMEQSPDLTSPNSSSELSLFVINQGAYPFFEIGPPP